MKKRLYRSSTDVKISGVCAGIAEFFNIDPTIVRVIYAILTVPGIIHGVIIYAILAYVMPKNPVSDMENDSDFYDVDN